MAAVVLATRKQKKNITRRLGRVDLLRAFRAGFSMPAHSFVCPEQHKTSGDIKQDWSKAIARVSAGQLPGFDCCVCCLETAEFAGPVTEYDDDETCEECAWSEPLCRRCMQRNFGFRNCLQCLWSSTTSRRDAHLARLNTAGHLELRFQ